MKKRICLLVFMLMICIGSFALADVTINKTNFPDARFREVIEDFDSNKDGTLSDAEVAAVEEIDCNEKSIKTLKGIECFSALKKLNCMGNELKMLDVSKNTALTFLDCSYNYTLTTLDVSQNTALLDLSCSGNLLSTLDVSQNTALIRLACSTNRLTALDVSKNAELINLHCDNNSLTTLDVSKNTVLSILHCSENSLTSLDVSMNTALTELNCEGNALTALDVSKNIALEILNCSGTELLSLDVSRNVALKNLDCSGNSLPTLDVSRSVALMMLNCGSNQLTALDVSYNTMLDTLICHSNQLTKVDVSACPTLVSLVKQYPRTDGRRGGYYDQFGNGEFVHILAIDKTVTVIAGDFISEPLVDISKAIIAPIPDQVYTGKAMNPNLTIKLKGKSLEKGIDYSAEYSNNKAIGKATVTISGKGKYKGTKTTSFRIVPGKVTISSLEAGEQLLTVKWEKGSGIDGYEIEYSLKKDFNGAKKVKVKEAKTTSYQIKKLKAKTIYYVRIRAFKKVNGKKYYSEWSKVMKKKTK